MNATTKAPSPRRIGIADLEDRLAINRTTIWRWYSAGTFPMPHYIGTRRCWWLHDLEAWEAAQAGQRAPVRPGLLHPAPFLRTPRTPLPTKLMPEERKQLPVT